MPERAYSSDAPLYCSAASGTATNAAANSLRATKNACRSVSRWASRGSLTAPCYRLGSASRTWLSLRSPQEEVIARSETCRVFQSPCRLVGHRDGQDVQARPDLLVRRLRRRGEG